MNSKNAACFTVEEMNSVLNVLANLELKVSEGQKVVQIINYLKSKFEESECEPKDDKKQDSGF